MRLRFFMFYGLMFCTGSIFGQTIGVEKDSVQHIPTDSLIKNFLQSQKQELSYTYDSERMDSLREEQKKKLQEEFKAKLRAPKVTGSSSLIHDYGLIPSFVDSSITGSLSMFSTRGDWSVQSFNVPLRVSYSYANYRLPFGLNNYFRVGVDFNQIKKNKLELDNVYKDGYGEAMLQNRVNSDSLTGKIGYVQVLKDYAKNRLEEEQKKYSKEQFDRDQLSDSLLSRGKSDSLTMKLDEQRERMAYYQSMYDTLNQVYDLLWGAYETYQRTDKELSRQVDQLNPKEKLLAQAGKSDFLAGFKKFNLGLSYPQTTGLSSTSVPVKGLDVQHQWGDWYTAFAAGLTVNTLMPTNNLVQNALSNQQNDYNFFDFQSLQENLWLTSLKTGWGTPEEKHFFVGFRHLTPVGFLHKTSDKNVPSSFGMELDLRLKWKRLPHTLMDLVVGKTTPAQRETDTEIPSFWEARSTTSLIRLQQELPRLRTEVTATWRRIDPLADTRNMGVLQADNTQMELQTKHKLTSRFSMVFNYRDARNNLDKRQDTTLHIQLLGGQVNVSLGRLLNIVGSINHVNSSSVNRQGQVSSSRQTYLFNGLISTNYRKNKVIGIVSAAYSDNYIGTNQGIVFFRNQNVQHTVRFKKWQWNTAFNYLESNQQDSSNLYSGIAIWSSKMQWTSSRLVVSGTLRYAPAQEESTGYTVESSWQFNNYFNLALKFDKPILGDYLNTFLVERYEQFPYTIQTKLTFTLNTN